MTQQNRTDLDFLNRKALDATPPISGQTYAVACSTTSAAVQIPDALLGSRVTFVGDASIDIFILFGTSGVVADNAATSGSTVCLRIPANAERSWTLLKDQGYTHFAVKAASGTPALRYYKASR